MNPNDTLKFVGISAADPWVFMAIDLCTIPNNFLQDWGLKRPRRFMKERLQN